jgi:putative flippase GtrA
MSREFARFLVAGGINTALTYALYLVLLEPLGYLSSYSVAYVVGIVLSYFLASRFVFRTGTSIASFFRYPLVYVAQYLVGSIVLWACVEWAGMKKEIAVLVAVAATIPVTYFVSRVILSPKRR